MIRTLLMLLASIVFTGELHAAEKQPPLDDRKITKEMLDNKEAFVFKPRERRDPLYSVLEEVKVKHEIDEAIRQEKAEQEGEAGNTEKEPDIKYVPDDDPILDALNKARHFADRSQVELLNGNWDLAIAEAESGLKELKTLPASEKHANAIQVETVRLNGFRQTARDAALNQEAEDKFNALKLQVQGIMWSADQRSLAIISGEAYYVQDKIGDGKNAVTIVNIDPNRVDFMINHVQRNFEFKRYIDN